MGVAIVLGAGLAGFSVYNGPKQGMCVGIAASFLIAGYNLALNTVPLEETILVGI
jgi:hypothetical protein